MSGHADTHADSTSPLRLVVVAPYPVWPPRSGGAALVMGAARGLAEWGPEAGHVAGHVAPSVNVFSMGLRRDLGWRCLRPATAHLAPGLTVHRHVGMRLLLWGLGSRQANGLPPLAADRVLAPAPTPLNVWLNAADVVQVEGPYGMAAVDARAPAHVPRVLVAHNVEARLAVQTLGPGPKAAALCQRIADLEWGAMTRADGIIALTEADRMQILDDYRVPPSRVRVIPAGVASIPVLPPAERDALRHRLGWTGRRVAIFVGSRHAPNRDAVAVLQRLAARGGVQADTHYVIVGRVGEGLRAAPNLTVTGGVDDIHPYLAAADVAVNPVTWGSGMHIKVLDYLSHGLPVLTTRHGVRGLALPLPAGVTVVDAGESPAGEPPAGAPDGGWLDAPELDEAAFARAVARALRAVPDRTADEGGDSDRINADDGAADRRAWVQHHHGWHRVAAARYAFYQELLARPRPLDPHHA